MSRFNRLISCVLRREVSSSSPALFSRGVTLSPILFRTYFFVAQELPSAVTATTPKIAAALSFIDPPGTYLDSSSAADTERRTVPAVTTPARSMLNLPGRLPVNYTKKGPNAKLISTKAPGESRNYENPHHHCWGINIRSSGHGARRSHLQCATAHLQSSCKPGPVIVCTGPQPVSAEDTH